MIPRGKKIYLCRPDCSIITQLNGVQADNVSYDAHVKDYDELHFIVDQYITVDGEQVKSNGYDLLDVYMNVYLEDIGYFQMQAPQKNNDGIKETKTITAYSLEKEWEQHDWVGFKVNTGDTDSLEQLAEDNLDEMGFAKEFVQFYRPSKQDLSLIHLLLTKMPGWSVRDADIDPILWEKTNRFESDNSNLYALATSIIAPKVECIFLFDTINKRIKAISKERLNDYTYDTNIFIGFRNLANVVDVDVDEDSVFTRFNVRGDDDLMFLDVNYGDSHVVDYSYFLHEPYMSTTTAEKIENWLEWRDDNRDDYVALSRQAAGVNEDIYETKYRVPDDGVDWSQWDSMTEEMLQQNLDYYNALLTSLQVSVDDDPQYDQNDEYIPWDDGEGGVDHDSYLQALYALANGYGGYYTYFEVLNYIIPNIEIAIDNLGVVEDEKQDYVKAYETNWDLYGIEELEGKKKDYEGRLEALASYSKAWSQMTADEKAIYFNDENQYNASGRTEYLKYSGYLGTEQTTGTLLYKLAQLYSALAQYEATLADIDDDISDMQSHASLEYNGWGFTADELKLIGTLNHDTDYTNSNILTTSVDTTITKIDVEMELYNDAVSKISEVSQPQYRFSVDLDNLLNIPEFQNWIDKFELLNFFRLGIKDDYAVKLRMVGYSYNPCDITSDLNIEFSSMITSRSGRSDLTDLLNSDDNRGSKNSISIGTGNSDTDKEYLTNLLQLMTKNSIFKNSVANIAGNTVVTGNGMDTAAVGAFVSDYIKVAKIDVGNIIGEEADFNRLFSNYIDSSYIVTNLLNATNADFQNMTANSALVSNILTVGTNSITTIAEGVISTAQISADQITSGTIDTGRLNVSGIVTAQSVLAGLVDATQANFNQFTAQSGFVQFLQSQSNTAIEAKAQTGYFYDLVAGNLTVADLATHTASAQEIVLISSDGTSPAIAFSGATQQFYDDNGNVRVQIGQDGNGDFNFIVKGADGTTALFNENGITQNGIPNSTIVNNMISNGTIQKGKLAFTAMEANAQGGIDITQVYDGSGNLWGVQYTSFKQGTEQALSSLSDAVGDASYRLYIETPNGKNLRGGSITLNAKLYYNSEDVTDEWNAQYFTWKRHSLDSQADLVWNSNHSTGTKSITLTSSDVNIEADFECCFEANGVSVSSNGGE